MVTLSTMPLPAELLHMIMSNLSSTHNCRTCFQHDLLALAQTSKVLNSIATPYLYASICLRSHSNSTTTASTTCQDVHAEKKYENRLRLLIRTLETSPHISGLVKRVRFAHEQKATMQLWTSVVSKTPGLKILQGVDTFFEDPEADEDDTTARAVDNASALRTLCGLPGLTQAVVHNEVIPCKLSTLLTSWPKLETLVLGEFTASTDPEADDDAECSYDDLIEAFNNVRTGNSGFPSHLKNVYFQDCDLDYTSTSDRKQLLPSLPPLERLGIDGSLTFTLIDVTAFLSQSRIHGERLHTIDFHNQLRCQNSLGSLVGLLRHATGLQHISLNLVRWFFDEIDELPEGLLESKTLQTFRWAPQYKWFSSALTLHGHDEFNCLLLSSLRAGTLPALQSLTIAHEVSHKESGGERVPVPDFEIIKQLAELAEQRPDIVCVDMKKHKAGAVRVAVLDTVETKIRQVVAGDRISGLKRGVTKSAVLQRCDASKGCEEGDSAGEEEDVGYVGKEELWGAGGDLVALWSHDF